MTLHDGVLILMANGKLSVEYVILWCLNLLETRKYEADPERESKCMKNLVRQIVYIIKINI